MDARAMAAVRSMLDTVPDTDQAMVIYADGEGGADFRFIGMTQRAAAIVLRNVAAALDAEEGTLPDGVTLQ